jgi:nitrate reductase beta subunit
VENFHMLKQRQTADEVTSMSGRVNLLNWDAKGGTAGLFPPRQGGEQPDEHATAPRPQGPTDEAGPTGAGRHP